MNLDILSKLKNGHLPSKKKKKVNKKAKFNCVPAKSPSRH